MRVYHDESMGAVFVDSGVPLEHHPESNQNYGFWFSNDDQENQKGLKRCIERAETYRALHEEKV